MGKEKKLLSIIVPSYNMEAYLPKCLGSLIVDDKELLQKLDVIVVNDGSKDRTSEIAHEFESKYPGVFRVIDKENGHYGSCINAGLAEVQGVYVKILDADDWFFTEDFCKFICRLQSECKKNNEYDLILTYFSQVDSNGDIIRSYGINCLIGNAIEFERIVDFVSYHIPMPHVTYKTEILRNMGYKQAEHSLYTDLEWVSYPMRNVNRIIYFPCNIYRYVVGRVGQSVEESSFYKNIGQIESLVLRMLENYDSLCGNRIDVQRYINKVITAQLQLVYHARLIGLSKRDTSKLLLLDKLFMAKCAREYEVLGEAVASSRRFVFHYVKEFRSHKTRRTLRFALFDLYSKIVKCIKR